MRIKADMTVSGKVKIGRKTVFVCHGMRSYLATRFGLRDMTFYAFDDFRLVYRPIRPLVKLLRGRENERR